ncbi:MAG TPA: UdgX family uracil-DNA binding protein [Casimicrobiaceae bacterium]|nr:UdgX family uracil-DNA binding protein [Casimicrobiaceae bacterium]
MQSTPEFDAWRLKARQLLAAGRAPEDVHWDDEIQASLLDSHDPEQPRSMESDCDVRIRAEDVANTRIRIPSRLLELFEACACHRDRRRHALMYRLLWRATHGERELLDDAANDDVRTLTQMAKSVSRDCHKMHAYVRFRELPATTATEAHFVASYKPEHRNLRRATPFFVKRFGTMVWTIVTPEGAAHWNRAQLSFLPVDPALTVPAADAKEALWLTYYESIFNPARLNVRAMQHHMPQKYWPNLPEAARIPALIANANLRAGRMVETVSLREVPFRGPSRDPARELRADKLAIDACRRCELCERATQGVAGEGPARAAVMIVGEQPGDEEDLAGRPFVGPAGTLLRAAVAEAGLAIDQVFLTNAVKHFRWEPRGKRRIHKTPAQKHIAACGVWLDAEIERVRPTVIVACGATAIQALSGQRLRVGDARSLRITHRSGVRIVATYHPSAVLRTPDERARERMRAALVADLAKALVDA